MPGDAGYWPPGGQRRADHGDYLDEDDLDQLPGYHGRDEYRGSGGHGQPGYEADGFARRGELERPSGYGEPDHYRDGAYGESSGYGNRPGYGDPADYGDQPGYGDPAGQRGYGGQDGGYGSQNGYGDPSGYGDPGGYGEPSGYRDRAGYDDHRDYGAREASLATPSIRTIRSAAPGRAAHAGARSQGRASLARHRATCRPASIRGRICRRRAVTSPTATSTRGR